VFRFDFLQVKQGSPVVLGDPQGSPRHLGHNPVIFSPFINLVSCHKKSLCGSLLIVDNPVTETDINDFIYHITYLVYIGGV
jgi:hypothetical protein